ncbi:hypothetical protein [Gordonia sp. VNK21]|uniref:DUF7144 family membrane protein n=1 Tax=Gordonia sp. VNK21 TaxID=3382483 RepID=UPI0038D4A88C
MAASLLLIASVLAIFQAIAALVGDDTLVVFDETTDYVYEFSLTTWGWIHLVVGIIGLLIAWGLFRAAEWARVAAIVIAAISIVSNFLWLPYTPWWSILVIVLQIIVIWSVANWRGL